MSDRIAPKTFWVTIGSWFSRLAYAFEVDPNNELASRLHDLETRLRVLEQQADERSQGEEILSEIATRHQM